MVRDGCAPHRSSPNISVQLVSSRVLLETILVIFHMRNPEANIGEKSELRDDIHWRI